MSQQVQALAIKADDPSSISRCKERKDTTSGWWNMYAPTLAMCPRGLLIGQSDGDSSSLASFFPHVLN